MTYVIRFDFPEGSVFAGLHKGALGWAPTLRTAMLFEDADTARRTIDNGYGPSSQDWAKVVPVTA